MHAQCTTADPFRSALVPSGFVTGDEGLGHVVFGTMDPQAPERFYCDRLGMRLSDRIEAELAPGFSLLVTFLHANPRHHTVAFAAALLPKRMHHFMLEVGTMDDVGYAYDRCLTAGIEIAQTLGVHPNDRMFSFYARRAAADGFASFWLSQITGPDALTALAAVAADAPGIELGTSIVPVYGRHPITLAAQALTA